MLIEIKEFKGVATKADPSDLGLQFALKNQNFYLDTPGALIKHPSRGAATSYVDNEFDNLIIWSPGNLQTDNTVVPPTWVGWDEYGNVLKQIINTNILSNTSPISLGNSYGNSNSPNLPESFDFQDHNIDFRMAPSNLKHGPMILQWIGRNFFDGEFSVNEYVFQNALLSHESSTSVSLARLSPLPLSTDSGMNLEPATYNYKLGFVYDGTQELPLQNGFKTISITNSTTAVRLYINFNKAAATGTAPNKSYPFNPRLTNVKIYRETDNSGNYFLE